MNNPASDHILGLLTISLHMGCSGMGFEVIGAFPFFEEDKGIWSVRGLKASPAFRIDGGLVFNAAVLGMDRGEIAAGEFQKRITLTWLGGDDGNDLYN